jgi:hypothetical protein
MITVTTRDSAVWITVHLALIVHIRGTVYEWERNYSVKLKDFSFLNSYKFFSHLKFRVQLVRDLIFVGIHLQYYRK